MKALSLHLGGKVGELLYLSAVLPAIRGRWPGVPLTLYLHPAYHGIVAGLRDKPDHLGLATGFSPAHPLAAQVIEINRQVARSSASLPMWRDHEGEWHANCYGLHQVAEGRKWTEPFYRLFALAADAHVSGVRPGWSPTLPLDGTLAGGDLAIVFPAGNIHVGHPRALELSPAWWERTASALRRAGLKPLAIVHPDDGPLPWGPPGWESYTGGDPRCVLEFLTRARAVVGLNSGITFAACQLSPGRVTMLDTKNGQRMYQFGPMFEDGTLDPRRHVQARADDVTNLEAFVERSLLP